MRRIVFLSLALIIACAAAPALPAMAEQTGRVEGRVMYKEQPVEGAGVYAYREPESLFAKPPVVRPAVSDASGRFVLELPRGKYFLAATKKGTGTKEVLEAGDYYSFYGGNPVDVDPKRPVKLTLNLAVKPAPQEDTASDGERSGVEGVVAVNGEPLDGAVLFVYLDANDYFRGLITPFNIIAAILVVPGLYLIATRFLFGLAAVTGALHRLPVLAQNAARSSPARASRTRRRSTVIDERSSAGSGRNVSTADSAAARRRSPAMETMGRTAPP